MARYRKVDVRIHNDEKFRRLSKPKPSGQALWVYLLTCPGTSNLPGLLALGRAGLAELLDWSVEDLSRVWDEIEHEGMARADWAARLIWLPNAIRYNEPESPNVVASWRTSLDELPQCALLELATEEIETHLAAMGQQWIGAWRLANSREWRPSRIPSSIRDEVRDRDRNRCRYCSTEVNWNDHRGDAGGTFDHINPAGPSKTGNLVVACRKCNSFKGFRTPAEAGMEIRGKTTGLTVIEPGSTRDEPPAPSSNQEQEQEPEQKHEPEGKDPDTAARAASAAKAAETRKISDWFDGVLVPIFPEIRRTTQITSARNFVLRTLRPDEEARAKISDHAEAWARTDDWRKEGGRYASGLKRFFDDRKHLKLPPNGGDHGKSGQDRGGTRSNGGDAFAADRQRESERKRQLGLGAGSPPGESVPPVRSAAP